MYEKPFGGSQHFLPQQVQFRRAGLPAELELHLHGPRPQHAKTVAVAGTTYLPGICLEDFLLFPTSAGENSICRQMPQEDKSLKPPKMVVSFCGTLLKDRYTLRLSQSTSRQKREVGLILLSTFRYGCDFFQLKLLFGQLAFVSRGALSKSRRLKQQLLCSPSSPQIRVKK